MKRLKLTLILVLWAVVMVAALSFCVFCKGATLPVPKFSSVLRLPMPKFEKLKEHTVKPVVDPIDQEFLEQNHWWLSPGTCGMLGCTVHGGGWVRGSNNRGTVVEKSSQAREDAAHPYRAPVVRQKQRRGLICRLRGG